MDSQTKLPQLLMLCNVDFDKDLHFQKCIKLNDLFDINYLSLPGEIYIVCTFGSIFQCRLGGKTHLSNKLVQFVSKMYQLSTYQFNIALAVKQQVLRLQISVHNAPEVKVRE